MTTPKEQAAKMVNRIREETSGKLKARMAESKVTAGIFWVFIDGQAEINGRNADFNVANRFESQEQAAECLNEIMTML